MATKTKEVRDLHRELEDLTGWKTDSTDVTYLRRRLADIKTRIAQGDDVTHRAESAVCSFSTTVSAKQALERVIATEKKKGGEGSMSKLARAGIAMWLKKNGYAEAAELMGGE